MAYPPISSNSRCQWRQLTDMTSETRSVRCQCCWKTNNCLCHKGLLPLFLLRIIQFNGTISQESHLNSTIRAWSAEGVRQVRQGLQVLTSTQQLRPQVACRRTLLAPCQLSEMKYWPTGTHPTQAALSFHLAVALEAQARWRSLRKSQTREYVSS